MQRRVGERNERSQPVVAAGELDHHEHLVVGDAFLLGRVDRARERVGHGGVTGREASGAGAEDESRAQEVAPLELVDADLVLHVTHLLELEFR